MDLIKYLFQHPRIVEPSSFGEFVVVASKVEPISTPAGEQSRLKGVT
jgi:hypothetical protein